MWKKKRNRSYFSFKYFIEKHKNLLSIIYYYGLSQSDSQYEVSFISAIKRAYII